MNLDERIRAGNMYLIRYHHRIAMKHFNMVAEIVSELVDRGDNNEDNINN